MNNVQNELFREDGEWNGTLQLQNEGIVVHLYFLETVALHEQSRPIFPSA